MPAQPRPHRLQPVVLGGLGQLGDPHGPGQLGVDPIPGQDQRPVRSSCSPPVRDVQVIGGERVQRRLQLAHRHLPHRSNTCTNSTPPTRRPDESPGQTPVHRFAACLDRRDRWGEATCKPTGRGGIRARLASEGAATPASENRQFSSPSPGMLHPMTEALDHERCYRAVAGRDARFDGWFFTAVRTTGIYCRPSLPGAHPAGPQRHLLHDRRRRAGGRLPGCRRCRPDAVPGSPRVGRAGRRRRPGHAPDRRRRGRPRAACPASPPRLGYCRAPTAPAARRRARRRSARAGPRAAGADRAAAASRPPTCRMSDVAFAAGFASIRQFNDTVREVFATTPSGLRGAKHARGTAARPADHPPAGRP